MPVTFYVDQHLTFKTITYLGCSPKMAFGSDRQDVTKGGIPKWEVQVAVGFERFGRIENEVLKVSVVSHSDPGEALSAPRRVMLAGFRIRVHPVERRVDKNAVERSVGGATYQADGIVVHDE